MTIQDINERVRQDLGEQPLYAWKWQKDLIMLIAKETVTDTEHRGLVEQVPKYDYVADPETGLIKLDIEYEEVPYPLPKIYHDKWIFCSLQKTLMSPEQWRAATQGCSPYPWGGTWAPVGWGLDLITTSLEPGDEFWEVSKMITSKIKACRDRFRDKDVRALELKQIEAREKKTLESYIDHAGEVMPYADHEPGKKDHVSWPTTKQDHDPGRVRLVS